MALISGFDTSSSYFCPLTHFLFLASKIFFTIFKKILTFIKSSSKNPSTSHHSHHYFLKLWCDSRCLKRLYSVFWMLVRTIIPSTVDPKSTLYLVFYKNQYLHQDASLGTFHQIYTLERKYNLLLGEHKDTLHLKNYSLGNVYIWFSFCQFAKLHFLLKVVYEYYFCGSSNRLKYSHFGQF